MVDFSTLTGTSGRSSRQGNVRIKGPGEREMGRALSTTARLFHRRVKEKLGRGSELCVKDGGSPFTFRIRVEEEVKLKREWRDEIQATPRRRQKGRRGRQQSPFSQTSLIIPQLYVSLLGGRSSRKSARKRPRTAVPRINGIRVCGRMYPVQSDRNQVIACYQKPLLVLTIFLRRRTFLRSLAWPP